MIDRLFMVLSVLVVLSALANSEELPNAEKDLSNDNKIKEVCPPATVLEDEVALIVDLHGSAECPISFNCSKMIRAVIVKDSSFLFFDHIEILNEGNDPPLNGIQILNSHNITFNVTSVSITGPNKVGVLINNTSDVELLDVLVYGSAYGIVVANSKEFLMRHCMVTNTSDYCVVLNETTSFSLIEQTSFLNNSGRGVLVGSFAPDDVPFHDPLEQYNGINNCNFDDLDGMNVVLGYTASETTVAECNFSVSFDSSPQEWACIFIEESYGNHIVRNVIDNEPDRSKMYVAVMIVNSDALGAPNEFEQNFIKLHTEGYAIHALNNNPSVKVCVSNIVSDTHYTTSTNAYVDWSC